MIAFDENNITNAKLYLWILHRFSEVFKEHVVLKGGIHLMLMNSERETNDIDFVFVPFKSKKDILPKIDSLLSELPGAKIEKSLHSNSGRYRIFMKKISVQIEFNVESEVSSTNLSTELLARKVNELPRVIRVMSSNTAFAHKLAAWNERRLARDIYDVYYWFAHVNALPDKKVLETRLKKINSRIPRLKKIKNMTMDQFTDEFQKELNKLTEKIFIKEISPCIKEEKIQGKFEIIKSKLNELCILLKTNFEEKRVD